MISPARLLGDWRRVPGINHLFQPSQFIRDDGLLITKQGRLCLGFRMEGQDAEGMDDEQRRRAVEHLELAFRTLDERVHVQQYVLKRRLPVPAPSAVGPVAAQRLVNDRAAAVFADRPPYAIELYLVLTHDGLASASLDTLGRWRDRFVYQSVVTMTRTAMDEAARELDRMAAACLTHLRPFGPTRLDKAGMFALLRRCVNYTDPGVRLTENAHVDFYMGDERVTRDRGVVTEVGTTPIVLLSMKTAPASTFAWLWEDVTALPADLMICVRWRRESPAAVRRALTTMRNVLHTTGLSALAIAASSSGTERAPANREKAAYADEIGTALEELALGSHFYGTCSVTVACLGAEAERTAATVARVMAERDGAMHRETIGSLLAWLSLVPGNLDTDVRGLRLLESHAADLCGVFTYATGSRTPGHRGRGPIAVFDTPSGVPYAFSPYVRDIGHRFTSGTTGSGKTTLEALLLAHAMQYDPHVIVLDFGRGYERVGQYYGASQITFGMETTVPMNPLDQPDTPEHRQFVHAFVKMLIEGQDQFRLTDAADRQLTAAIDAVFSPSFYRPDRRLTGMYHMLQLPLNARLEQWITGGRYGHLFDHSVDQVGTNPFQIFELEAMKADRHRDLKAPLLSYLFRLADLAVHRGTRPVIVLLADAAQFLEDPVIRAQVLTGLDTWRKFDGSLILETQSIGQIQRIDPNLARTVVERCDTMLFLPNRRGIDPQTYREVFGFHDRDIDLLRTIQHTQALVRQQHTSRVINVTIPPDQLALYQSPVSDRHPEPVASRSLP